MANNEKSLPIHYLCAAPRFIDLHHISPQPLIFKNDCMELAFCEIHSIALIRLFVLHPLMLSGSLEPESGDECEVFETWAHNAWRP